MYNVPYFKNCFKCSQTDNYLRSKSPLTPIKLSDIPYKPYTFLIISTKKIIVFFSLSVLMKYVWCWSAHDINLTCPGSIWLSWYWEYWLWNPCQSCFDHTLILININLNTAVASSSIVFCWYVNSIEFSFLSGTVFKTKPCRLQSRLKPDQTTQDLLYHPAFFAYIVLLWNTLLCFIGNARLRIFSLDIQISHLIPQL